jgi:hypothetical protein
MRVPPALLAFALVGALSVSARADVDERGGITVGFGFAMGSFEIGDLHAFQAPAAHFDLGFRVRRWRLAAEADTGIWSATPESDTRDGGVSRVGMALRYAWMDRGYATNNDRPSAQFRIFAEIGVGRQHIATDQMELGRNDLMLGVGTTPEMKLGPVLFGATFGLRMLISRAPATTIARGACTNCGDHSLDVALLSTLTVNLGH